MKRSATGTNNTLQEQDKLKKARKSSGEKKESLTCSKCSQEFATPALRYSHRPCYEKQCEFCLKLYVLKYLETHCQSCKKNPNRIKGGSSRQILENPQSDNEAKTTNEDDNVIKPQHVDTPHGDSGEIDSFGKIPSLKTKTAPSYLTVVQQSSSRTLYKDVIRTTIIKKAGPIEEVDATITVEVFNSVFHVSLSYTKMDAQSKGQENFYIIEITEESFRKLKTDNGWTTTFDSFSKLLLSVLQNCQKQNDCFLSSVCKVSFTINDKDEGFGELKISTHNGFCVNKIIDFRLCKIYIAEEPNLDNYAMELQGCQTQMQQLIKERDILQNENNNLKTQNEKLTGEIQEKSIKKGVDKNNLIENTPVNQEESNVLEEGNDDNGETITYTSNEIGIEYDFGNDSKHQLILGDTKNLSENLLSASVDVSEAKDCSKQGCQETICRLNLTIVRLSESHEEVTQSNLQLQEKNKKLENECSAEREKLKDLNEDYRKKLSDLSNKIIELKNSYRNKINDLKRSVKTEKDKNLKNVESYVPNQAELKKIKKFAPDRNMQVPLIKET